MKKFVVTFGCAVFMSSSFAQNAPPVREITKQIIRAVNGYANSISCGGVAVGPKDIAALVPYKTLYDYDDARYAVLWHGDIGCAGGSGTTTVNIAIVTVGRFDSFVVDPLLSSPVVSFPMGLEHLELIGNTRDSLVLDGFEYGPKDARCCPSVPFRVTMRVDEKGNWKVIKWRRRY
jgi:hypothetical protein